MRPQNDGGAAPRSLENGAASPHRRCSLELTLSLAGCGIAFLDRDGSTLETMDFGFARMHGYRAGELRGVSLGSVFEPGFRTELPGLFRAAEQKHHCSFESPNLGKDGSVFSCSAELSPVRDGGGGDVTFWILSLQEAQARAREGPVHAAVISEDGRLAFFSEAQRASLGYSREELLAMPFWDIEPGMTADRYAAFWPEFREIGLDASEIRLRGKDGQTLQLTHLSRFVSHHGQSLCCAWLFDPDKNSVGKALADAQELLQESEETTRALLGIPTDYAAVVDTKGVVLDANETMARRFGKSASELIGVCGWDLFPPDLAKSRRAHFDRAIQSGNPVRFEDERQGVWFDSVYYPICNAAGRVTRVAIVARDITERKRLEDDLRRRTTELEEANTALKVLLGNRDEGLAALEHSIQSNVRVLLSPLLRRLKSSSLTKDQAAVVDSLESELSQIVAPFCRDLLTAHGDLTPRELEIASLIKEGMTSQEIARLTCLSSDGVAFHRRSIRTKLGLKGKKANLRSYLQRFT